MRWANKRKAIFIASFFVVLIVLVIVPTFFFTYKAPTCFDKKQNQGEEGVDCGGPCTILCAPSLIDPVVLWSRSFKVADGKYNAVAYIQNLNSNAIIKNVPYRFRIFDDKGLLIQERSGIATIPARSSYVVFEPAIPTGFRIPTRTVFDFLVKPVWIKVNVIYPNITIDNQGIKDSDSAPKLTAKINNNSLQAAQNLGVVAIVYDSDDNAVGVSKTVVDFLDAKSSTNVYYTWPYPFESSPLSVELIALPLPLQ